LLFLTFSDNKSGVSMQ